MNGIHDMGGMHGMGPIVREENEPVFHHTWEGRAYALSRVVRFGGRWNLDAFRYAQEQTPPDEYLRLSYYERWLQTVVNHLVASGVLSEEELASGRASSDGTKLPRVGLEEVRASLAPRGARALTLPSPVAAGEGKFDLGQRVVAKRMAPVGHTRLPRYVRGRRGIVERDLGVFHLPDTVAHGGDPRPQHVYSVRFEASELWGADASARSAVYVDCWEDYLEAVT
ncbi:MAG: nitrile hydratase subunit beta [Chloroflexi bacterium]|nr:nitrile hydratase subunit beta [Chloroflexota bacterium]